MPECTDLFRLDIGGLLEFAEVRLPQAAISRYVGRDLKLTAVGKGLDGRVQKRRGAAYLHMQRSRQEENAPANPIPKPNAPMRKVSSGRSERQSGGDPTQWGHQR
jgi:hypothetical protein